MNSEKTPMGADAEEYMYRIRRDRMRQLIDLDHDGFIAHLFKDCAITETRSRGSYISQLLSGHRNFTDKAARALESQLGKPRGWLDGLGDPVMAFKIVESNTRAACFRELLTEAHGGNIDFSALKLGKSYGTWVSGLVNGTRYLSEPAARRLLKSCGLRADALEKALSAKAANEPKK